MELSWDLSTDHCLQRSSVDHSAREFDSCAVLCEPVRKWLVWSTGYFRTKTSQGWRREHVVLYATNSDLSELCPTKLAHRAEAVLKCPSVPFNVNNLRSQSPLSRQRSPFETQIGDRLQITVFACPSAVQYRFLAVPYNDFERHPRLVSC